MGEIKLNNAEMDKYIRNMDSLATATKNYSASISFAKSKGDTVDALNNLASKLEKIRDEIANLCVETKNALQNTKDTFNETDNTVADCFDGKNNG